MFMFIVKASHTLTARLTSCSVDGGYCGCTEYGQLVNVIARSETDCIAVINRHCNGGDIDNITAAVKRAERFRIQTADTESRIVAELMT